MTIIITSQQWMLFLLKKWHITSFNGYEPYRAFSTLKRQTELLKPGGIIVVRDFVKPPEMEILLDIKNTSENDKPSDADLLVNFSRTARALAHPDEKGFPLKEVNSHVKEVRRFRLFFADAIEFIRKCRLFAKTQSEI